MSPRLRGEARSARPGIICSWSARAPRGGAWASGRRVRSSAPQGRARPSAPVDAAVLPHERAGEGVRHQSPGRSRADSVASGPSWRPATSVARSPRRWTTRMSRATLLVLGHDGQLDRGRLAVAPARERFGDDQHALRIAQRVDEHVGGRLLGQTSASAEVRASRAASEPARRLRRARGPGLDGRDLEGVAPSWPSATVMPKVTTRASSMGSSVRTRRPR